MHREVSKSCLFGVAVTFMTHFFLLCFFFCFVFMSAILRCPDGCWEGGKKKKKISSNALTDTLAAHISRGTYPHFRDSHQVIEFLCIVSVFFMHAVKGLFLHRLCACIRKKKKKKREPECGLLLTSDFPHAASIIPGWSSSDFVPAPLLNSLSD